MQRALDEIGELTGSPVGFYHLVEEDQNTLTLTAWSTRTEAEFCKAAGKGSHYPIAEAGVWVDCVHRQTAVIHNDYASLPHRKGLPAGHADVVRELVVPTIQEGRIVSVLGVGNKPTDYDQLDVELVSYIADVIWTIVGQKRANEQIRQLNVRLEQLAKTDELTGLPNRRDFFSRGEQEIKRALRYHTPISLLMLDIDEFKRLNDTCGHEAGDRALQCIAKTLQNNIREVDILARLGGEEFGILLPNTGALDAAALGERLRFAAERETFPGLDPNMHLTVSVGVATPGPEGLDLDVLLRKADQAMYRAKGLGRNRVEFLS